MTNDTQTQNDEDFDYGCECAMTLLNEPTEDCLNDLIDELDEDGMIATEVVYGLLATILMSITSEDEEDEEIQQSTTVPRPEAKIDPWHAPW